MLFSGLINCLTVNLDANPPFTIMNLENDLSVIVDPKESTLCVMYMGDGNCAYILTPVDFHVQLSPTRFGGSVGYGFSEKGTYNNSVVCENNGDIVSAWDVIHVIDKIKGLQLIPDHDVPIFVEVHQRKFPDVFINFTFTSGERIFGSYDVDSIPMNSSKFSFDEEAKTGYLQLIPDGVSDFKFHSVSMSFKNGGSWGDLSANFSYEQAIEQLTVDTSSTEVLINSTVDVTASSAWGTRIRYHWTVNGLPADSGHKLTRTLTKLGTEQIAVNASNAVGFAVSTKILQVVNPVLGFQASFLPESLVDIVLQAPPGELFPMGSLRVELSSDYANQPAMNISAEPLVNITLTSRLSGPGDTVRLRVFSEVSEQIILIKKPTGLKFIELSPSANPVEEDVEFEIVLQHSAGLTFSYVINFGDGKSLLESTSSYGSGDLTVTHKYTRPGEYQLQVNMSKDNDVEFRETAVFVKSTIPDFLFSTEENLPLSNALATFSVLSYATEQPLTEISCSLDYDDGAALDNFTWADVTSRNVQHRYNQPGSFQPTMACFNGVSKKIKIRNLEVFSFSYEDFVILYDTPVAMNSSANAVEVTFTVQLLSQVLPPTGVTFTWDFGDQTPAETDPLTSWVKTHNYTARGTFIIKVNISLADGSWGTRHVPIKIGIVTVSTTRSLGAVGRDEFAVRVSADVHGGANCRVDFGNGQVTHDHVSFVTADYVHTVATTYRSQGSFSPEITVWNANFTEHHVIADGFTAEFALDGLVMSMEPSRIEQSSLSTLTIGLRDDNKRPSNVSCTVNFGEESEVVTFRPDWVQQFRRSHVFEALGRLSVDVSCANAVSNQSETLYVDVFTQCYGVVRPFSSVESPVMKLVSEQLALTANPDIQCTNMTAEFHWSIDALINGSDKPLDVAQPNSTVLLLRRRSMKPGKYRVTFYSNFRAVPTSYSSDSVIVIYDESPLVARIKGGTLKTSAVSWPTILDAVTYSKDPDTEPSSRDSQLAFQWTYAVLNKKLDAERLLNGSLGSGYGSCSSCLDVTLKPQGVVVLTPGCLAVDHWHVFTVNVSKPGRSAQYTQIIHVVRDNPPQVDIRYKVLITHVKIEICLSARR